MNMWPFCNTQTWIKTLFFITLFTENATKHFIYLLYTKNSAHFVVPATLLCVIIKSLQIWFTAVVRILS